MRKKIGKLLLCVTIVYVSNINCGDEYVDISKYFVNVRSLEIDKKYALSSISDIAMYDDTTFVLTDFFARKIFLFNSNTSLLNIISQTGRGPGEYIWPERIFIRRDKIYFSDIQSVLIKKINIKGEYIPKDMNVGQNNGRFCLDSSENIYVMMSVPFDGLVKKKYSETGNEKLACSILKESGGYNIMSRRGGGICCDSKDNIYLCNIFEYKIIKMDSSLGIITYFKRSKSLKYFKVAQGWNKKIWNRKERIESAENSSIINNLFYLISDTGQEYILVFIIKNENNNRSNYLDIWETNGKFISTIKLNNEWVLNVSKNYLFTYVNTGSETNQRINIYKVR